MVTGFLGSGKTTLLRELLRQYSDRKRILLIQNEFADSGVDGTELAAGGWNFSLLEMNKGSVFCVCLFSDFKRIMVEQLERSEVDMVVLEATGVADPIAVGQLINDPQVAQYMYLSHIWCIADAVNLMKMAAGVRCIPNQIRVADSVVVNKCDCVDDAQIERIDTYIKEMNPYAKIMHATFCNIDFSKTLDVLWGLQPVVVRRSISGELTKCSQREMTSHVFKTSQSISRDRLDALLRELPEGVVRLKGFVRLDSGESMMVQYVSGSFELTPIRHDLQTSELIAIGIAPVDFERYW